MSGDSVRRMERHGIFVVAPVAALLLTIPILLEKRGMLTGADIGAHVQFTLGLLESLKHGTLFPRWLAEVNYGFGAPVFLFYPPLAYYLTALTTWVTGKSVLGFNVAFALAGTASAFSFHRACRELVCSRAALAGAFLYTLAPYHAWHLHAGYYAEYVAYALLPMIWLFVRRLIDAPTPGNVAALGLWSTVLAMTHLPTTVTVAATMGLYISIRLWGRKVGKSLAAIAAAGCLAFLCGAAYFLPMLLEQDRIDVGIVTDPWGDYRRWLIPLAKLQSLTWTATFAGTLLFTFVAICAVAVVLRPRLEVTSTDAARTRRAEGIAMSAVVLFAFFLQLSMSGRLWELIPRLYLIQFPWRFGSPHALGYCVLVALALSTRTLDRSAAWRWRLLLTGILAVPGIAHSLSERAQLTPYRFDQHALDTDVHLKNRMNATFVPRPVPRNILLLAPGGTLLPPAVWADEGGLVQVRQWTPEYRELSVSTPRPNRLEIRTFHYPGWIARLDGKLVPLEAPIYPLYVLAVMVPPGENQKLELIFESTPLRTGAAALTVVGLLGVALLVLVERRTTGSS